MGLGRGLASLPDVAILIFKMPLICRRLRLREWLVSELPFELPLESLSLSCQLWIPSSMSGPQVQRIGGITTLTSLELQNLRSCYDPSSLQTLPLLQRLTFKNCCQLALVLLMSDEPGIFASLQELHTEDGNPAGVHVAKVRAVECMSAVLQLPRIRKISGNTTLLTEGLPQKPLGWHVSNDDGGFRVFTKL